MTILMPIEIFCEEHPEVKLNGEYNELRRRFELSPCSKCIEDAEQSEYSEGYDEGYDRGLEEGQAEGKEA